MLGDTVTKLQPAANDGNGAPSQYTPIARNECVHHVSACWLAPTKTPRADMLDTFPLTLSLLGGQSVGLFP